MTDHVNFYTANPSWIQFHGDLSRCISRFHGKELEPVSFSGVEGAFDYFTDVVNRAAKLKTKLPKATVDVIAKECTELLVRLPCVLLENTIVDVYDFSSSHERDGNSYFCADDCAKSLMYTEPTTLHGFGGILGRIPTGDDFPECGIRLPGSNANFVHSSSHRSFQASYDSNESQITEILSYDSLPLIPTQSTQPLPLLAHALPKDRNSPFRVAFVIALRDFTKKLGHRNYPDATNPKLVQELADYLQSFLEVTPGRSLAFGVMTNFHECFFVAVYVSEYVAGSVHDRSYQSFSSPVIVGKDAVARELANFCATSPVAMGLNPALFHSPHLAIEANLGREVRGVLMEGRWKGDRIALKVNTHKGALDLERALLLYLEARGVTQVPRIHRTAQEDLYPRYNESCTAFSTILSRVPQHYVTLEQMLQVWGILRSLHTVGIVHRNVRAVNMMCGDDGAMYLTNFDAAQFYTHTLSPDMHEQLVTASGKTLAELQALYNPRNVNTASAAVLEGNLSTLPADEACAIIYAAMQVNFRESTVNRPLPVHAQRWVSTRDIWWYMRWKDYVTPAMTVDIHIVDRTLLELRERRADPAYTPEHIHSAVLAAVGAVYRFKEAMDMALEADGIPATTTECLGLDGELPRSLKDMGKSRSAVAAAVNSDEKKDEEVQKNDEDER